MTHHPGEIVDDSWLLLGPIHTGGMGELWRASPLEDGGEVAVKFLGRDLTDDAVAKDRLDREAANLAAIDSRHVTRLIARGSGCLILEYLEGESLAGTLTRRHSLPPGEVARVLGGCADGLAAAHLAGVLHRDVKPSNIVLSERGAVLADFGISQGLGDDRLTDPGRVMGTAEYLAPELIEGAPASPSSDIYALGICAFEALTGAPPFRGDGVVATARAHVDLPVPPLPDDVPDFLRTLVTAMLAKDPGARPSALRAGAVARGLLDVDTAHDEPDTLGRETGSPHPRSQHPEEDQW